MILRLNKRVVVAMLLLCLGVMLSSTAFAYPVFLLEYPQGSVPSFSQLPFAEYSSFGLEGVTPLVPPANDPIHRCVADNGGETTGSHTLWIPFSIAAGSVTLSTDGTYTNYDTIMTLYRYTPQVEELVALACSDDIDATNGNYRSLISTSLSAGQYILQVSRVSTAPAPTLNLTVGMAYLADTPAPTNDLLAGAVNIPSANNKAIKTLDAHAVRDEDADDVSVNAAFPCQMYNTVWYQFTPAFDGLYNFSTYQSQLYRGDNRPYTDTVLQVVHYSFATAPAPCSDGPVYAAAHDIQLEGGELYYIRVGTFNPINLLPPSFYRIKVTTHDLYLSFSVAGGGLLVNEDFESGLLSPWKTKNFNGADGITAAAIAGTYSVEITAQTGLVKSLSNSVSFPRAGGFIPQKDDSFNIAYLYKTVGVVNGTVQLKIEYANTSPTIVKRALVSNSVNDVYSVLDAVVVNKSVTRVTVKLQVKSGTGTITFDSYGMRYFGSPIRSAAPLLALPSAQ